MLVPPRFAAFASTLAMLPALVLVGCGGAGTSGGTAGTGTGGGGSSVAVPPQTMSGNYTLTGNVSLVHDPAIVRQGSIYYSMSTDPGDQTGLPQVGYLPIRCSTDKINWTRCGQVFNTVPAPVLNRFPSLKVLWAPDISYFNGLYHVYYAASGFGANGSIIGVATSPTMTQTASNYGWTDQGIVLQSYSTDNFNAIDPSVLVDTDGSGNVTHVWMAYGSFWGGIYERELDPTTGKLSTTNTAVINLAARPGVTNNPVEGASLVKHNGFYYLFVSFDYCCSNPISSADYKIAVGRSTSPNGPFVDQAGIAMTSGGGSILLSSGSQWIAPGGETVYIDPVGGDLITFHALSVAQNYLDYLFVEPITWVSDWPQINQP
ncbi:MAG: arabinan endo-1,5-alpha-L-arabinosidase [Acidobacteriota bacterium]|nr:arabinan endo-1,5-alpha-L-arabinosidase [Acidobacteriota bacterium]